MDVFNIAIQLAFILLFVVVLARYLRQPRAVHRDLVLVFASVVALFVIAIALAVWPTLPRGLSTLSAVVLLLQPYLTLRLARHFVPVSRNVATGSLIWFGVAVLGLAIGIRGNILMTAIVIGYFVAVEAIAASFLLRAHDCASRRLPHSCSPGGSWSPVRVRQPRRPVGRRTSP